MAHSRTEEPTRKRIEDARRRGQVPHSREVDTALVLLASFAALRFGGGRAWSGLEALLRDSFAVLDPDPLNTELTAMVGTDLIWRATTILLPLIAAIAAVALIGGLAQTGGVVSTQAVKPKASRLNPLQGAKRIFASKQTLVTLAKSLLKFAIIVGIALLTLRSRQDDLVAMGLLTDLGPSLRTLSDIGFDILLRVALALVVLGLADYLFQRYQLMSQLKMTRQEVRDELRQTDGDPQMRNRMVAVRRSFLTRVMQSVPQADVVITNPTHYAVALKYDTTSDAAPRVIAKGERLLAQRIREIAMEHGIPIVENPPLARAIYRAVPVNHEITADLYEAVAAVLAFVYRLRYPQARTVA